MGRAGKTGLLGHRTDAQFRGLQQLLGCLDAAVVDVVHDGLPRHPLEQAAEVVGRQVEPRCHLAEGELLAVVGGQIRTDALHRLIVGPGHRAALRDAFLLDVMQHQQQVQRARVIRLLHGGAHQLQQGAQAAVPLHGTVQHSRLLRLKQPGKIPLGLGAQLVQGTEWETAAHQLRCRTARLLDAAAAGSQQQRTARVEQHGLLCVLQGTAALCHQHNVAALLFGGQLQLAAVQVHRHCPDLCTDFFLFCLHSLTSSAHIRFSFYHTMPARCGQAKTIDQEVFS